MRTHLLLAALAVALFAIGVHGSQSATPENAMMEADRAFDRATSQRGAEGWMEFMAADAVILHPQGPVVGTSAIRDRYRNIFGSGLKLRWQPDKAELISPGFGYTVGTWKSESPRPDGTTATATGRYLSVWRKQSDGSWKVVADGGE